MKKWAWPSTSYYHDICVQELRKIMTTSTAVVSVPAKIKLGTSHLS
jgi:hypothetical protein